MKFGETFTEYLHGEQEQFLEKCSNVEYKQLKKVLKSCQVCRAVQDFSSDEPDMEQKSASSESCQCETCPVCDQKFFAELTKEASEIAGCFSSRVKRLIQLHDSPGLRRYMRCLRPCFTNDQQAMIQEGRMLIDYVTMNAIAIRKILKKYDKKHSSVTGRNFKTKMRAEHIELLQSPWLIELGAFYMNSNWSASDGPSEFFKQFSCDLSDTQPVMTLTLSDSVKLEFSLTCAVCLDTIFNPYALGCGHLFCKGCACSAASVLLFQGPKAAPTSAKCPICRAVGVYGDAVHMTELALLLKSRCLDYWKERKDGERAEILKQSKEYWELQTKYAVGF